MGKSLIDLLEQQEVIDKLVSAGYGELIDAVLMNESKCFTKKGKVNKSGTCRVLNWKTKQLEDAFLACRTILQEGQED